MKKITLIAVIIVICLTICACQKDEINNTNNNTNSSNNVKELIAVTETPEERIEKDKKRINETINIINANSASRKEGNRYINKIDDNHFGVYYTENGTISGYEYYVMCESGEAEFAKASYSDPDRTVESIYVVDNIMIVKYGHVEYEGITIESVEDYIKE